MAPFGSSAGVGVFFCCGCRAGRGGSRTGFDEALGGGLFFGALHVFGDAGVAGSSGREGFGGQVVYAQRLASRIGPCRKSGRS